MSNRRTELIARGLLVVAALVLLPLAALLQTPRPGAAQAAAQDSLWAGGTVSTYSIGTCANPSSPAALASCFNGWIPTQGVAPTAMATDGVNVYYAGRYGGLSCPIADLGANCTRIMAGPWPKKLGVLGGLNEVNAIVAADGQIWIGQGSGEIYRCPGNLPYKEQDNAPSQCVELDDAGQRGVLSLLLANGRLYAGLSPYKNQGFLWSCDPQKASACSALDSYGDTGANSLAAGGGYLWAGLRNGIIWRCDLNTKNACSDWATPGGEVNSVSHDGQDTLYAAVANGIWSCQTAAADGCSHVLSNVFGDSVAAGAGGVFSSVNKSPTFHFGTAAFSSGYSDAVLLYVPAGGPVGVGGVAVNASAGNLGGKLAKRCQAGKNPKLVVMVTGVNGLAKTVKAGACALAKGGTVKTTFDLLDPGAYKATVRAGKYTGQVSFTVVPDRMKPVKIELKRGSTGG